jgi:lipoprotein-anchoring transpeptidase ErfK/SrfK/LysM repeat protein
MKLLIITSLALQFTAAQAILPQKHVVSPKETLFSIARQHGTSVAELKSRNGLKSDLIRVGQELLLGTPKTEVAQPINTPIPAEAQPPNLLETLRALPESDRWKLHLYLDRVQFAPGKLDGLMGEFTVKTIERWIAAQEGRSLDSLLAEARKNIGETQATFTIPATAATWIAPMPATLPEKAASPSLLYETLAEYTAERFHTDLSTLCRLNPGMELTQLKFGDKLRVPTVKPFIIETWPPAGIASRKAPEGTTLRIDHDARMIEVLGADGHLTATFPITVSPKPEHRRSGTWHIQAMAPNPRFLWDDVMLKEGRAGKVKHDLPPGPNNPVGVLWLDIEPDQGPQAHIGIHGTADPARIGRNHSSGCIRLANWDITRLVKLVGKGTKIVWKTSTVPQAIAMTR